MLYPDNDADFQKKLPQSRFKPLEAVLPKIYEVLHLAISLESIGAYHVNRIPKMLSSLFLPRATSSAVGPWRGSVSSLHPPF